MKHHIKLEHLTRENELLMKPKPSGVIVIIFIAAPIVLGLIGAGIAWVLRW